MDLPLIGGHAPGVSGKQDAQTLVNLVIDGDYLKNRPGYERYDRNSITPSAPTDLFQDINSLTLSGDIVTVNGYPRFGYEVGDSVQISGSARTGWNDTWTIVSVGSDGKTFTFDQTENSASESTENPSSAQVRISGLKYKKEIRLMQRYVSGSQVFVRAVIGNRIYLFENGGGAWTEDTLGPNRFISMNGAVAGAQMGDLVTDGVILCDGVAATAEGVQPQSLTYVGNETGTHNGSNNAAVLTDTTKSWTTNEFLGLTIQNTTDGSSGTITDNTATTITATLTGGTDNDWDTGDAYSILVGWSSYALTVKSNTCTFMDGYIIRDDIDNNGRFVYSDLYDASVENPFNFATAEGSPDDLLAVLADRRELLLLGEATTEIWYNIGDKDLPFSRFQGGFAEIGIAAPLTAKRFDNSTVWLAQDRRGGLTVVRLGNGYQPTVISTPQIEYQLNKARDYIYNAHAFVMRWRGHEFYVLTIPSSYDMTIGGTGETRPTPVTYVFDARSGQWAQWKSHDSLLSANDRGRWMPTAHLYTYDLDDRDVKISVTFGNMHLLGGRDNSGELYMVVDGTHVDEHSAGSQVIECERTLPPVMAPNKKRFGLGAVELETDLDAGGGGTYSLSYAKDGKTFTTPASRTIGSGTSRLMWKKLGRAYRWILRFAADTAASVPVTMLRAVSTEPGDD